MPKQPTIKQLAEQAGKLRDTLLKMSLRSTQTAKGAAPAPAPAPTRTKPAPVKRPPQKERVQTFGMSKDGKQAQAKRPVPEHLKPYLFKAKKKGPGK